MFKFVKNKILTISVKPRLLTDKEVSIIKKKINNTLYHVNLETLRSIKRGDTRIGDTVSVNVEFKINE